MSSRAIYWQEKFTQLRASDAAILDAQRVIANAQKTAGDAALNTAIEHAVEAQKYRTDEYGKIAALDQGVPTK